MPSIPRTRYRTAMIRRNTVLALMLALLDDDAEVTRDASLGLQLLGQEKLIEEVVQKRPTKFRRSPHVLTLPKIRVEPYHPH